ncbi:MAG: hypothetical protein DCC49_13805 [Acidobacteria bacterium]|nr:MAG: hypothetical protein DCC49_13805 [Acidobacteriota bacterium]
MGGSRYSYDTLGRLVAAHDAELGDDYEYQYDLASNRTEVRKNGELTQALSFTTADEIDTALHPEYAYDLAGRLISDTTASGEKRSYHWDGYGRLSGIDLYSPTTGHAENLRLSYDASGRLSERREYIDLTWPVSHLFYHYDGDRLVGEEDMTGTVREYLYAGGEAPAAMRSRNTDGSYSNYFFVTNTHGDVVALTDRDGNIVNRYAYGPWGEATRVSEQVHQPFRYAGYRYEDGFDLYYLRARWLDPNTGRFLSRDDYRGNPRSVASLNRYAYAFGRPTSVTDPSGLSPQSPNAGTSGSCGICTSVLGCILDSYAFDCLKWSWYIGLGAEYQEWVESLPFPIPGPPIIPISSHDLREIAATLREGASDMPALRCAYEQGRPAPWDVCNRLTAFKALQPIMGYALAAVGAVVSFATAGAAAPAFFVAGGVLALYQSSLNNVYDKQCGGM